MADEIIIETTSTEVVEVGTPGPQGPAGTNGTNGQGVPVGGTTGQVLRKASDANYDTEWATGGGGGVSSWNDLTDKPATFPPSSHTHQISEVTNLQTALDGKAASSHTHTLAAITDAGTAAAVDADQNLGTTDSVTFAGVTVVGSTFKVDSIAAAAVGAPAQLDLGNGDYSSPGGTFVFTTGTNKLAVGTEIEFIGEDATANAATTRTNLGLGTAATADIGTGSTQVAAGNHTHADATTTVAGFLSAADKTKLDGIASGATANSSDSTLLNRANHTGTQAANTITGLAAIATSGSASDLTTGTVATARLGTGTANSTSFLRGDGVWATTPETLVIACSDETTNLTTGTAKVTFRMPYAMTLTAVRASVNTAPTGSTLIVDINEGANSILSTKLSIDASEKTSTTAASAAVISDSALADDAEMTIDIDQIGSTIAGKGLKVALIGTRA